MNYSIRCFEERDRSEVREIYLVARRAAFAWPGSGMFKADDFERETEGEHIFVAESSERVVGFASLWTADNFLHHLFVHPEAWRRGVGRLLLRHCETVMNAPLTLKCLKANSRALQFYARMRWRIVGEGYAPEGSYFLMVSGHGCGDGREAFSGSPPSAFNARD